MSAACCRLAALAAREGEAVGSVTKHENRTRVTHPVLGADGEPVRARNGRIRTEVVPGPDGKPLREVTSVTWRARYRDAAGKEHAAHFARRADAQRWLDEQTAGLVTGQWADPRAGRIVWRDWCAKWMEAQAWTAGTRQAAETAVQSVPWSEQPIGSVRASQVQAWVTGEAKRGLAATTIRTRLNYVQMAFRAAVFDKVISASPAVGAKAPRPRRAEATMRILTAEQLAAALGAADEWFHPFIAVCAFAGLRLGEAAGLQLGDVDFLRRTISVSRQVQGATAGTTAIVPPKYGSERTVYVPAELVDLLAGHVAAQGIAGPTDHLFRRPTGELLNRNSAGNLWRQVRATVGLPTEVTLHTLRHTFASNLIAAGCDVVTVQRALGHGQPSITLNTYSHLWPTAEDRTRTATRDFMTSVLAASADAVRTDEANAQVSALPHR